MGPRLFAIGDWVRIHSSKQNNLYEVESVRPLDGKDWVYTDDGSTLPADALELVSTLREREEEASLGDASIRASLRAAGISAPEPEEGTPRKPEPAEPLVYSAAADIPERFQCSRCDDSDDAFCAEHTYWSTKNAEFQRFWREFNDTGKVPGWAQDTPRKPKPGDRVSTTLNDENGSTVVGKYVYVEQDAVHGQALIEGEGFLLRVRLSEITVIKPAWPADPKCDIEEDTEPGDTLLWKYNPASGSYDDGTCDRSVRWEDLWSEAVAEGSKLYPIRRERGPVIGG